MIMEMFNALQLVAFIIIATITSFMVFNDLLISSLVCGLMVFAVYIYIKYGSKSK